MSALSHCVRGGHPIAAALEVCYPEVVELLLKKVLWRAQAHHYRQCRRNRCPAPGVHHCAVPVATLAPVCGMIAMMA